MCNKKKSIDFLNSIEEAIKEMKLGKPIIVVDDEKRENEGDFILAAEKITSEWVNFFIKFARGLLCVALNENRCQELELEMMVKNNTDPKETNFTVSIDLKDNEVSTGISVFDRAKTIKALCSPLKKAKDFHRPGHIFPLKAKKNGVLERPGHTEAAVDLARLSGCFPAATLIEILNEDGSMARMPELIQIAKNFDFKIISIKDLIAYRKR